MLGGLWLVAAMLFTVPALPLTKMAFVGVWLDNNQPFPLEPPSGERWVSFEQVQRELLFRNWQPPLTISQMADLATALEADAAVDVRATALRRQRRWVAVVVVRVVSATLRETIHLSQARLGIRQPQEIQQVIAQVVPSLLAAIPKQIPVASVQVREGQRRVHLVASEGEWRKGMKLLFFRNAGGKWIPLGKGEVTVAQRSAVTAQWIVEARLTDANAAVRSGDKAVPIFAPPEWLAKGGTW